MQFENTAPDEFYIMGISVRTANANGQAQTDIGELWSRFFSQNAISQIPDKVNIDFYCVYKNYKSGYQGSYTTVLGCKVQYT